MNRIDALKARVAPGNPVSFTYRNRRVGGRVVSLGRKCAVVRAGDGEQYRVPYDRIRQLGPVTDHSAVERRALERCRELMRRHGLEDGGWVAALDDSRSRAGACYSRKKRITLSRLYVRAAGPADLDDTILHEIAHALVGTHHHHDAVWQAKAREIGCSGERCHAVRFCPPRWTVACAAGCFTQTAHRRRRGVVCRRCRGPVVWRPWEGAPDQGAPAAPPPPAAASQPVQAEFDFGEEPMNHLKTRNNPPSLPVNRRRT